MTGLSDSANGLWGSRTGLASSTSLSTPPGVLADVYSPSALFATNEIGTWYDPSDLTTLFQDSAGTTAVTAPAQSVGLMLDKSKGLVLGPQLASSPYTGAGSGTWAVSSTSITRNNSSTGQATLNLNTVIDTTKRYLVTFTVSNLSGDTFYVRLGGGTTYQVSQTGNYSARLIGGGAFATMVFGPWAGTAGEVTITNISVRELPGNHATASGTTRPIYAIVPKTGRRNLLTNTPFAGAVSGSPGTNPTSWGGGLFSGTRTLTLSGETLRLVVNGETNINQTISVAANTSYIFSIKVNVTTASQVQEHIRLSSGPAGSTLSYTIDGSVVSASTTVPTGEHIIASRLAVGATAGTAQARFGCGFDGFSRVCDIVFSEPQAETGTSHTSYQRVVSAYEVTEAGVPSLSYLSFDGVDDFMVTGTITPGTDKAQVFAGVRKLSDAAQGEIAALGNVTSNEWRLQAPNAPAADSYIFLSRGTSVGSALAYGFRAPITNVLTGLGDISADLAILRVNGAQAASASSDQGAGNYSSNPLYIGRRGGTTLPFNGNLYGLITRFGPNLSSALITQTEQWLNTKTQAF